MTIYINSDTKIIYITNDVKLHYIIDYLKSKHADININDWTLSIGSPEMIDKITLDNTSNFLNYLNE